jgi:hypothetical protein
LRSERLGQNRREKEAKKKTEAIFEERKISGGSLLSKKKR